MGSYTSVMNDTDDATMYIKYTYACGEELGAMPQIATLIADALAVSTPPAISTARAVYPDSRIIAFKIDEKLRQDGFARISPRHSYVSTKLSLSLVHRANIILVQRLEGGVKIRRGAMTVWSGQTDASTHTYTASDCRYELETVISDSDRRGSRISLLEFVQCAWAAHRRFPFATSL